MGIYLFGSLTYDDFRVDRSDIDLMTVINREVTAEETDRIKKLHEQIEEKFPLLAKRLECSYTPEILLKNLLPPVEPRPYYGVGTFYPNAQYGNEWIINLYLLQKHGICVYGPKFSTLTPPIDITEVQKACVRDLFKEWEPKINDSKWLKNSHYQSYLVLNLCRILYTVLRSRAGSKTEAASWVKNQFPQWKELICEADSWKYGSHMNRLSETSGFIKFTVKVIKKTNFYLVI